MGSTSIYRQDGRYVSLLTRSIELQTRLMFRILSLDGGGILGTFSASVLATIEEDTGRPISEHFDLITGTSTGGMLAIGLAFGLTPAQLLNFYLTHGPSIFPVTGRFARTRGLLRQLLGVIFSHEPLTEALKEILGDRPFGEAGRRLVIPTYDAVGGRIYLFKTPHHPHLAQDAKVQAAEVARVTSAAPTYFEAARPEARFGAQFIDGGVWANSPCLVGLVEAVTFLGVPLDKIDISASAPRRLRSASPITSVPARWTGSSGW